MPFMSAANPTREIKDDLQFRTFAEFGAAIGWSIWKTSRVIKSPILKPGPRKDLLHYLDTTERDVPSVVFQRLGVDLPGAGTLPPPAGTSRRKTGWEPPKFEPIEHAAFSWALSFRNSALLEELSRHALRSGLGCTRYLDALELSPRNAGERRPSASGRYSGLFAEGAGFGLSAGTVLMLGAASRHNESVTLRRAFSRDLLLDGKRCEISQFDDRPAYFGYQSVLKLMKVGRETTLHPDRWAESEYCTVYEDAAAIFHAPLHMVYKRKKAPYGKTVKRFILVAALQRLANGLSCRLLSDPVFRDYYAGSQSFEESIGLDVFVFRVRVANDDYGTTIRLFQVIDSRDGKVLRSIPDHTTW